MQALTNGVNNLLQYLPEASNLDQYPILRDIYNLGVDAFYILAEVFCRTVPLIIFLDTCLFSYLPPVLVVVTATISCIAYTALFIDIYIPGLRNYFHSLMYRPYFFPKLFEMKLWVSQCLGLDINTWSDISGITPLILAVQFDSPSCLEILLRDNRITPNQVIGEGYTAKTALNVAAKCNSTDCLDILLRDSRITPNQVIGAEYSALFKAIYYGREASLKVLLSYKDLDINFLHPDGENTLQKICLCGELYPDFIACFKFLLNDERILLNNGTEPLLHASIRHLAVFTKKFDYLEAILQSPKVNIHHTNQDGLDAINYLITAFIQNSDFIERLKNENQSLTNKGKRIISLLAEYGAKINEALVQRLKETRPLIFQEIIKPFNNRIGEERNKIKEKLLEQTSLFSVASNIIAEYALPMFE